MGKGKGKKGRKEAKLAAKKANEPPKIPGVPKPSNPIKKAKKIPSREKRSAINSNPPGPADFPIPMGRPKPFTKSPQHAKWPALFKKHLGVIEAHIRNLDKIMQSMKVDMQNMSEKERLEVEKGEKGNWRAICDMMDRAREVLSNAREAARGILPSRQLRDKSGLGVSGTNFEPLGPQTTNKAADIGYDNLGRGELADESDEVGKDEDMEMTDASGSSSESDSSSDSDDEADKVVNGADFISLNTGKKQSGLNGGELPEDKQNRSTANDADPTPLFFVDTQGTPVNITSISGQNLSKAAMKRERKIQLTEGRAAKKAKREADKAARVAAAKAAEGPGKSKKPEAEPVTESKSKSSSTIPDVDFVALEASLKAEVEAAAKAQAEAEEASRAEKNAKKKRRRSGDGDIEADVVEKKSKKENKEKDRKRKVDGSESAGDEGNEEKKKKRRQEA